MIKSFESYSYSYSYWKIRTDDPYLTISLIKIGESIDEPPPLKRFEFFNDNKTNKEYSPFVYILRSISGWEWNELGTMTPEKVKKNYPLYTYMGEVKVTKKEADIWDLKQNMKKYNL